MRLPLESLLYSACFELRFPLSSEPRPASTHRLEGEPSPNMAAHRADTGSYRLGNDAESRNDAEVRFTEHRKNAAPYIGRRELTLFPTAQTEAFLSPATTRGYSPDHMTSGQSNHDSDRSAALIDFTASPPPLHPAVPTTGGSTVPRPAFHHLLDDSFALESPPRLPLSAPEPAETAPPPVASPPEEDSPPVARPARKRWSVMTRLRDEARVQEARKSLSPIRGFSPTQSGELRTVLSAPAPH